MYAIAFALPLWAFGIEIGGYPFTILTVLFICLDGLLLLRASFVKSTFFWAVLLALWCFLTAAFRYSPTAYLASWFGLCVMLLPFCGVAENVRRERLLKFLVVGTLVSFCFGTYEIASNFVGLPRLGEVFTFGLWSQVQYTSQIGLTRVKATMAEPAHYSRYLVFVYATVDLAERNGLTFRGRRLFQATTLLMITATLSLTGIVLVIVYIFASSINAQKSNLISTLFSGRLLLTVLGLPVLVYLLYFSSGTVREIVDLVVRRINDSFRAYEYGVLKGSEGSRINSTFIVFDYLASQDLWHALTGEGYANYDRWLVEKYWYLDRGRSSFARGDLHNAFSVVGISTGLLGLLLYISFLSAIVRKYALPYLFALLWVVSHFSTGGIVKAQFWGIVLVAAIILQTQKPFTFIHSRSAQSHLGQKSRLNMPIRG
jgi:hypothetical protein